MYSLISYLPSPPLGLRLQIVCLLPAIEIGDLLLEFNFLPCVPGDQDVKVKKMKKNQLLPIRKPTIIDS